MTRLAAILATLALGIALAAIPNTAAAAAYCRWTLSRDHRTVTVYGPEGKARIQVGARTITLTIDEGDGWYRFRKPHPASKISVKARAFVDNEWHNCKRPR